MPKKKRLSPLGAEIVDSLTRFRDALADDTILPSISEKLLVSTPQVERQRDPEEISKEPDPIK